MKYTHMKYVSIPKVVFDPFGGQSSETCCSVQVLSIAEQAQGDLHNAISTLQFVCTGVKATAAPAPAARKVRAGRLWELGASCCPRLKEDAYGC